MTTTPAGWYDDGSGRQRWWDGQQWTEHFAPEAAAPVEPESPVAAEVPAGAETPAAEAPAAEAPATETPDAETPAYDSPVIPETPSVEDTVIRTTDATATETTPSVSDDLGAHSAPAAPVSPVAAPDQPAQGYPGAAPAYPGAYAAAPTGYPAAPAYGQSSPEAPKKISVLGLVGLGLSAVGTILAFIPLIGIVGFILLGAGFIVSLISLFLKGKKWPGIAGLILAVVGTIIGVAMFFFFLFTVAQSASDELDNLPSSSPSVEATDPGDTDGADDGTRPTTSEVAVGLTAILTSDGTEGYTESQLTCLADLLVVSDLDNATLRAIAESDGTLTDLDAVNGLAEVLGDTETVATCFVS